MLCAVHRHRVEVREVDRRGDRDRRHTLDLRQLRGRQSDRVTVVCDTGNAVHLDDGRVDVGGRDRQRVAVIVPRWRWRRTRARLVAEAEARVLVEVAPGPGHWGHCRRTHSAATRLHPCCRKSPCAPGSAGAANRFVPRVCRVGPWQIPQYSFVFVWRPSVRTGISVATHPATCGVSGGICASDRKRFNGRRCRFMRFAPSLIARNYATRPPRPPAGKTLSRADNPRALCRSPRLRVPRSRDADRSRCRCARRSGCRLP